MTSKSTCCDLHGPATIGDTLRNAHDGEGDCVSGNAPAATGGRRRVVVLGSTRSIGTNCLDVIEHLPDRLQCWGLSAHRRGKTLLEQVQKWRPRWAALTD